MSLVPLVSLVLASVAGTIGVAGELVSLVPLVSLVSASVAGVSLCAGATRAAGVG